jgi:hypothetical protein
MKECNKCGEVKDFTEFHKQKGTSDGFRTICKACRQGEHAPYYKKHKDKYNSKAVEWRKANPEKAKEAHKKYREANKQTRYQHKKQWIEKNRGKVNSYNSFRHSQKKQRTPVWLTDMDKLKIQCLYQLAAMYSKESGEEWHVDHFVPLQGENVSGLHVPWNLRVIPASVNLRKYNKHE